MPITKLMEGLPSRTMPQAEFDAGSEKYMSELPEWGSEANALEENVNALEVAAAASAVAAAGSASAAGISASQAQAASTNAIAAADLVATSTSPVSMTGSTIKSFVVQPGKAFKKNMPIRAAVSTLEGTTLDGYVKSYNTGTGALSMQVTQGQGSGTYTSWDLMFTGPLNVSSFLGGGLSYLYSGLAQARQLEPTDEKLQIVSCDSAAALVMPDPTDVPAGYHIFEIFNRPDDTYNNDLTLSDNLGTPVAYLPPGRSTAAHNDATGIFAAQWVFPDASPVGKPIRLRATASARVAGSAGTFVRAIKLDDFRTMLLIYGTSLHAIIHYWEPATDIGSNIDGSSYFGPLTLIRSAWGGTGSMDNVVALALDNHQVLVASCPENSTALQMVVLSNTESDPGDPYWLNITPGTAQTTAMGAASARLLEIIPVGSSFVLGYVNAAGAPRLQARTVSAGVVSAPGTEVVGVTGTAPPAMITGTSATFGVVTSTASLQSITPYTVSSGTTLTAGTAQTASATSINGMTVRKSDTGRWFVTLINGTARVQMASIVGATLTLTSDVSASTVVTTPSSVQAQSWGFDIQIAVTGTNASGEFITDFSSFSDTGSGVASLLGSRVQRYSLSTQTVAPAGNNYDGASSVVQAAWTISTANGNDLHTFQTVTNVGFVAVNSYRIGPSSVANGLPVQNIYPKQQLHNSVLSKYASLSFSTLGDGTKPALYSAVGNDMGTMRTSPQLIADPIKGAKTADQSALWLAYSMGTDARVILEQVRIA
jgi:hypothetical protein